MRSLLLCASSGLLFVCISLLTFLIGSGKPGRSSWQNTGMLEIEARPVRSLDQKRLLSRLRVAAARLRPIFDTFIPGRKVPRCTETDFEEAIFTIASCLEANMSLIQALEVVAQEAREPLRSHFALLVREYQVGVPLSTSLERLSLRLGTAEARLFTEALEVYRTHGGNILDVLEVLTESLREKRLFKEKVGALTSEARWSAVFLIGLPPVLTFITMTLQGDLTAKALADPLGRFSAIFALLLWLTGTAIIVKVVRL